LIKGAREVAGFLLIMHRRDAEAAEGYLFLLSAERPESKKTHTHNNDRSLKSNLIGYFYAEG